MRLCSVDGCDRKHKAHGYCITHLNRVKRHGSPQAERPIRRKAAKGELYSWLRSMIDGRGESDACWEWPGASTPDGYGTLWDGTRNRRVTHIALELSGSPAPSPHLIVMHICDNPPCVNPNHLTWGTHRDNTQDMLAKGRRPTTYNKGGPNGR